MFVIHITRYNRFLIEFDEFECSTILIFKKFLFYFSNRKYNIIKYNLRLIIYLNLSPNFKAYLKHGQKMKKNIIKIIIHEKDI